MSGGFGRVERTAPFSLNGFCGGTPSLPAVADKAGNAQAHQGQGRRLGGREGGGKDTEAGSVQAAAAGGDEVGDEGPGRAVVLLHIVGGGAVDEEVAVGSELQASGSEQAAA